MIICPDCSRACITESTHTCSVCGWRRGMHNEIPEYFTSNDRDSGMIDSYVDNYEELAQINLDKSNIDQRFLKNQAKNLIRYLPTLKGKYICDVGIGQGFLCDEIINAGASRIAAVDVSVSYLRRFVNSENVQPYIANAESLPFSKEFDVIVSTDVMEHVINVGSFLFSVNRALIDGGLFAVRVPYKEGLLNYSPHCGYKHAFGHLRSFDKYILNIYLKQAGFKIRSFHLDGFSLGTPHEWLYNTPRRKNFYHRLVAIISKNLDHPADAAQLNPLWAGMAMKPSEIVVVAEKVSSNE